MGGAVGDLVVVGVRAYGADSEEGDLAVGSDVLVDRESSGLGGESAGGEIEGAGGKESLEVGGGEEGGGDLELPELLVRRERESGNGHLGLN